jgi:MoxR-like ATPase
MNNAKEQKNDLNKLEKYLRDRGRQKGRELQEIKDRILYKVAGHLIAESNELIEELNLLFSPSEHGLSKKQIRMMSFSLSQIQTDGGGSEANLSEKMELMRGAQARLSAFMLKRRRSTDIKTRLKMIKKDLGQIIHKNSGLREYAGSWEVVNKISRIIDGIDQDVEDLSRKSPEAFLGHWMLKIRAWKKSYEKSGIIETTGIERETEKIVDEAIKKMEKVNGVITLLGPTGSGKTVVAKKIAETLSPQTDEDKEKNVPGYYFVSAHSKMTPDDLMYRTSITVTSTDAEDVPGLIIEKQKEYQKRNPEVVGEELEKANNHIEEVVKGQASERAFQTKTVLELVARASTEGKIVVIDEFNYLTPETLASINNIISTTPGKNGQIMIGDEVREFIVKEGFGVIFTGNVGKEYTSRQKLDQAFTNRILSGVVDYNYPPQELDGSLMDSILDEGDRLEGKKIPSRDLFQIAITQAVDMRGNLEGPNNLPDTLWRLSQTFGLIQGIASGKDIRDLGFNNPSHFQEITTLKIKSIYLSFRNLNQVVREWKLSNFSKPIEHYILENIILPASVLNEDEAAKLFYIFKWGGFFDSQQYGLVRVNNTNSATWSLSGLDKVEQHSGSEPSERKYFLPQEIVELVAGMKTPGYESLDQAEAEEIERGAKKEKVLLKMNRVVGELQEALKEQGDILKTICPLD